MSLCRLLLNHSPAFLNFAVAASEWLIGPGCVDGDSGCEWKHCDNQCRTQFEFNSETLEKDFKDLNPNWLDGTLTEASPTFIPITVDLGTTLSQKEGRC